MNDVPPVAGEAAAKKDSKKTVLWIVGAIIIILILLGLGKAMKGGIAGVPYVPGADTEQNRDGSVTYTTDEGSVTVGGGSMPGSWPSDAPTAYSGATFLYSGDTNPTTGAAGAAVMYTVDAPIQTVIDYYNDRLKASGWTVTSSAVAAGYHTVTATKDSRTFVAYAMEADGVTQVTSAIEL